MRIVVSAAAFLAAMSLSPSFAEDAHALLEKAATEAEARAKDRYAFTVVYEDLAEGGGKTFTLRFDPRLPSGKRWVALKPAEAELGKDERKRFKNLKKSDEADGNLIYDGLKASTSAAKLVSEDEERAVFEAPIRDKKTPEAIAKAISMTITLDKKGGYVREVALKSREPFKPAPVARVDVMEQTQRYEPLSPGGQALLRSSVSVASGEAMFKKFNSRVRMDYRDFEPVAADAVGAGK